MHHRSVQDSYRTQEGSNHLFMTGTETPIRILLIDDHEMFLVGLRLLLHSEPGLVVIGEARSRSEALDVAHQQPDIILLDLDLGSHSGTDLLAELLNIAPHARVLLLTGTVDPDRHLQAICQGAMGMVHKVEAPSLLLKAIRKVHAGEAWLNRAVVASAMTRLQTQSKKPDPIATKIATLTPREIEVIAALGEGLNTKEIGERLFISDKTVRHHLSSIFGKLQVADRFALMVFAYQHDLAKVPSRQASTTPSLNA